MAFPLAAVGTGLSIIGGIQGLLSGSSAERRARAAAEMALRDLEAAGEEEYAAVSSAGRRGLYDLVGTLRDALESGGRGMGAALAGAGVYNPSSVAGALTLQQRENTRETGRFATGLSETLARLKAGSKRQVAGMRLGLAQNRENYARETMAGSAGGLASILGSLGQMNLDRTGADNYNANKTVAGVRGATGSVLDMPNIPMANAPGLYPVGANTFPPPHRIQTMRLPRLLSTR